MIIANEKWKQNRIEYILYMYQIEDIIRSLNFDINIIESSIIEKFDQSPEIKVQIKEWYQQLITELKSEGKERVGHMERLISEVNSLQTFHKKLLTAYQDLEYQKLYKEAKPLLMELVKKSGGANLMNEIDVALTGIYGLLVLRLKGTEISDSTKEAMQKVSAMLAYLSSKFHKELEGDLDLNKSIRN